MSVGDRFRRSCWAWSQFCQRVYFFLARVVSFFSGQEVENQRVANGVDALTEDGENVSDQPKRVRPCAALSILTVFL
jgi:hypothetical protein